VPQRVRRSNRVGLSELSRFVYSVPSRVTSKNQVALRR
jgi:hypothetical protein